VQVEGKVALITGASSGIGLASARLLHDRGARVALVARSADRLAGIAGELGPEAAAFPCDVSRLEDLPGLVRDVIVHFGRLDILVNNAGVHHRGSMLRHTPADLAAMIQLNTAAPIALTRIAADHLPPGGCVVNVASLAGKVPVPGSALYSGSKAGLRFWALSAAEDLGERGIRMATVNPGPVDSGFLERDLENVTAMTFSQPMSTVEQVAAAVLACMESDRSPMEIDLPFASGKLATLSYVSRPLTRAVRPLLERRGQRAKEQFRARKGVD
jgi:short-subunit dehydrogenase